MKKYIKILFDGKSLRKTMSDNCLEEIQKYSWEHVLGKFELLMRMAVKTGPLLL